MPSVYNSDNFAGRVALAASYIAKNRSGTRTFDTCFEMGDGDAVVVALYRRTQKRPDSKLAKNLFKVLSPNTVMPEVNRLEGQDNLEAMAAKMRDGSFYREFPSVV